tara:strand:+ start:578 stop:1177 length:600 start_codon:yes stop_codon:yes gene_type:complete
VDSVKIVLLKAALLKACGKRVTLGALFPLRKDQSIWENKIVDFADIDCKKLVQQVNLKTWGGFLSSCKEEKSFAYVNGKSASFSDSIMKSSVEINNKNSDPVYILIQDKLSETQKKTESEGKGSNVTFTMTTLKKEHEKCNVEEEHLFVFITDGRFDKKDEKLSNNEIVIDKNNLKDWMGPLLALVRLARYTRKIQKKF